MPDIYHIRIEKEYAAAVIEDLKKMDAVEVLIDATPALPKLVFHKFRLLIYLF
mgnify:CR=1 FL=1